MLSYISKPLLYKISIPNRYLFQLYGFLSENQTDASTLFPGYDGIQKSIKEKMRYVILHIVLLIEPII